MKIFSLIFCLFICLSTLHSKHILSAEMTYECLSEGEYKVDLTLYRDCFGGGADFDQQIRIAIYEEESLYNSLNVSLLNSFTIIYNPYEDCNPNSNNICVEKGFYSFIIELPISEKPYTIAYQRCCWAYDILNIVEPEATGISATTTISPLAQTLCNKQTPLDFPLAFASCPDNKISIQLPVQDEEGDILEYQLCLPFVGGGTLGTAENPGDPTVCEGVIPESDCPPPYSEVELAEGFDIENPFPTVDGITLDNDTGEFSFTPSEIGRYVYSICYSEIRDGEVIGLGKTILQLANIVSEVNQVSNELDQKWKMYYNNSYSNLVIENDFTSSFSVSIFNGNGTNVYSTSSQEKSLNILTSDWPKGVYYVNVSMPSGSSSRKIIVY